jgi:predicted esterase YcpF (UPF0227 family)
MKTILYIHGFNSSSNSTKAKELANAFKDHNVISPTLDPNPIKALHSLIQIILENGNKNVIIVGTSLGGFYGLYLRQIFDIKAFIINPGYKPHETLKSCVGLNTRYGSNIAYKFKEKYLTTLEIYSNIIQKEKDFEKINFYFSNDDELLNHTELISNINKCDSLLMVDDSGHRFTKFELVINDIKNYLS